MRMTIILLTASFFISAVTGFSMDGVLTYHATDQAEPVESGSAQLRSQRDRLRTQSSPSSAMSRTFTIAEQKEISSNDGLYNLVRQKTEEAKKAAEEWKTQNRDVESLTKQEIADLLKKATEDSKYWFCLAREAWLLFLEKDSENVKKEHVPYIELLWRLVDEANQANTAMQDVADCYQKRLEELGGVESLSAEDTQPFQIDPNLVRRVSDSKNRPALEKKPASYERRSTMNPLNTEAYASSPRIQETTTRLPTLEDPLTSKSLDDVLQRWVGDAEVRYDEETNEYKSYYSRPTQLFGVVRRMAARTQLERNQHRAAAAKIVQDIGTDLAPAFKNDWNVLFKSALGEPLTPDLIKTIQKKIAKKCKEEEERTSMTLENSHGIAHFLKRVDEVWQYLRRRNGSNGYSQISDN